MYNMLTLMCNMLAIIYDILASLLHNIIASSCNMEAILYHVLAILPIILKILYRIHTDLHNNVFTYCIII
uniref:Uncharacterized protein n=1 Tax=Octopus bimaculoides TaxID=37653 RepID=A0A0L8FZI4_OCTBM